MTKPKKRAKEAEQVGRVLTTDEKGATIDWGDMTMRYSWVELRNFATTGKPYEQLYHDAQLMQKQKVFGRGQT